MGSFTSNAQVLGYTRPYGFDCAASFGVSIIFKNRLALDHGLGERRIERNFTHEINHRLHANRTLRDGRRAHVSDW